MTKQRKCWLLLLLLLWMCCPSLVLAEIQIFGLEDFNLGRWVIGAGPLQANSNICVTINPPAPYQVTAYGNGASIAFTLSNGANSLPYRMFFNDQPRLNGASELSPGQALGSQRSSRFGLRQTVCNRPTANISILVSDTELAQAPAGRYSGTLVIVVGPE